MTFARVAGGGGWVRTAARVLGVWILSWFAFAAIFLGFLLDARSPVLEWVAITFAVLIAPACGWSEYRGCASA